jgi:hypothetical protein
MIAKDAEAAAATAAAYLIAAITSLITSHLGFFKAIIKTLTP